MVREVPGRCSTGQDNALCGFIAATNVESLVNYSMWSCDSGGVTVTDPCAAGSEWLGIGCTEGFVSVIVLHNIALTGED